MYFWPNLFNISLSHWQINNLEKTEIKSPNTPKYIQGEIENYIYSYILHIPCTFSMDKLGMELGWNTGMKYRRVEIKQKKGECFCIWAFWVFQRKVLDWSSAQGLWFSSAVSTSSWVIDSLLACPLHVPVTWHTSHHSHLSHWLVILMQGTGTSRQKHRVL